MRELKFRVWHKEYEEYMDGYEVLLKNDGSVISRYALVTFDTDMPVNVVIEQYTGLKDKNGKEIYEGDIVDDGYSRTCKIRWSEHYTAFEAVNENEGYKTNVWFVAKYGEVVGNVNENPELLGERK